MLDLVLWWRDGCRMAGHTHRKPWQAAEQIHTRRKHLQNVGKIHHTAGRDQAEQLPPTIRHTAEQIETAAGYHQPDTLPESIKTDSKTGTGRADPAGRQHTPPDRSSRKPWQIIINRYAPETLAHFQTVRPLRHTTPRTRSKQPTQPRKQHSRTNCRPERRKPYKRQSDHANNI